MTPSARHRRQRPDRLCPGGVQGGHRDRAGRGGGSREAGGEERGEGRVACAVLLCSGEGGVGMLRLPLQGSGEVGDLGVACAGGVDKLDGKRRLFIRKRHPEPSQDLTHIVCRDGPRPAHAHAAKHRDKLPLRLSPPLLPPFLFIFLFHCIFVVVLGSACNVFSSLSSLCHPAAASSLFGDMLRLRGGRVRHLHTQSHARSALRPRLPRHTTCAPPLLRLQRRVAVGAKSHHDAELCEADEGPLQHVHALEQRLGLLAVAARPDSNQRCLHVIGIDAPIVLVSK
mmetsp:Transcript_25360/g.51657  ORF Transcript_25360/g.51657 Transcript_25360/m.51657 type:complete len:284 (+) Transcript_25360:675-1526(+)